MAFPNLSIVSKIFLLPKTKKNIAKDWAKPFFWRNVSIFQAFIFFIQSTPSKVVNYCLPNVFEEKRCSL
jgi:hypothetical protein